MEKIAYEFQWFRHWGGYELKGDWIVPKGVKKYPLGRLERLETLSLYAVFAGVRTPDDLLSFVTKYGSVTGSPGGDSVPDCLALAQFFRGLMSRKRNPKALASFFDSQMHENFWSWIEPAAHIDVCSHPKKGLRLRIRAEGLLGALWWQLVQKLTFGDSKIRVCPLPRCRKVFRAGSGTKRHGNTEFCCDEHRIEFYSHKRVAGTSAKVCLWADCGKEFPVGPGGRRSDARFCCDEHRKLFNNRKHSMKG